MSTSDEITQLLRRASAGDHEAEALLLPLVYQNLRRLAEAQLRKEKPGQTIQATALVHEAYLRLLGTKPIEWQDRCHFFRVTANLMRRILVDRARGRKAEKRGGDRTRVPLGDFLAFADTRIDDVLAVDEALKKLAKIDERQAEIVELRFFGGLTEEEIGAALEISTRTVKREWVMARAWLRAELEPLAEDRHEAQAEFGQPNGK